MYKCYNLDGIFVAELSEQGVLETDNQLFSLLFSIASKEKPAYEPVINSEAFIKTTKLMGFYFTYDSLSSQSDTVVVY